MAIVVPEFEHQIPKCRRLLISSLKQSRGRGEVSGGPTSSSIYSEQVTPRALAVTLSRRGEARRG